MTDLRDRLQTALGEAYTLERELGGGGMSRVFVAHEHGLDRDVVVKVLAPDLAADVSVERFAREVRLAARLQQANIVPLFAAGDADGVPYYSMPFVRGESLRARLARGEQYSLPDAVNVLRDVARALAYAHGEGIVHRDIKPENILLSGGAAVVTDFGIAKAINASRTDGAAASGTLTQAGHSIGTPAYMAPEQVGGDPSTDHRADIYAWGVIAWELLAGRHPFAGRSTHALLAAHISETPAALNDVQPNISALLSDLVRRCLSKDPASRPSSASELLAVLDQVATTPSATVVPFSTLQRRRLPWLRIAIVGAVVFAAFAVWLQSRRPATGAATPPIPKSLAVLPFESVGGDTANAYFAEGMADEVTTALSKVAGLRVAATSSSFMYRNKIADVREVGKALNVGAVLQGRVRRSGARMRITAELTSAVDGLVLGRYNYEREVKDVFAVQDEIARDIVSALRVTLAAGATPSSASGAKGTSDLEAYDLYQRGWFFLQQRGGGVARSIEYFRKALARDSMFARAWAQLGTAYGVLPLFALVPRDSTVGLARVAIAQALKYDSSSAEAYAAAGIADLLASQWREGGQHFERAIALDSNYGFAHRAYTTSLYQLGRAEDAFAEARLASRLDPLSPTTHFVATVVMLNGNRREEALAMGHRAAELDSTGGLPRLSYAMAEYFTGNVNEARRELAGVAAPPMGDPWKGYLLAATGDRAGAAAFLRDMQQQRGRNAFANIAEAWTYLGGGDTARALDALERAMRAREPIGFAVPFGMPNYDAVRHSPRFATVIRGYGLDPTHFGALATDRRP